MVRKLGFGLILALAAASPVFGQDWAAKMFETKEHDFGTVARGSKAEFDFVLSNPFLEDVHIAGVRSSCGCTTPKVVNATLKTYEQGAIHATFNTPSFLGQRGATLTVTIDRPYLAEVQLHVHGFIRSDVVFEPGSVQFGDVEQGSQSERKVVVNYSGWSDRQITGIKSSNPHVSATLVKSGQQNGWTSYVLAVRLDATAPVGYLHDHLVFVTDDSQAAQMPLPIEGRVVSGVSVSPSSLFMGIVQPGQEVTKSLVVRANQPFRIVSITCGDKSFTFGPEKDGSAKAVHVIPVTFSAGADPGKVAKTIRITTDLGKTAPELSAYAVVSAPADASE